MKSDDNMRKLSTRGRVSIPREIREFCQLKKGGRVHFIDYGGVMVIVPATADPLSLARGIAKGKMSLVKELLRRRAEDKQKEK
jgi:AbrB family looped-hinge helix DNA binding protein